jgi:hypothetical protein
VTGVKCPTKTKNKQTSDVGMSSNDRAVCESTELKKEKIFFHSHSLSLYLIAAWSLTKIKIDRSQSETKTNRE